jgi:hypothetical protein
MITQFKIFEKWESSHDIIYSCADFKVNDELGFESVWLASNVIKQLPELIIAENYAINDYDFQNIKINDENKRLFILHYMAQDENTIETIKKYNSGLIGNFIYFDEVNGRKKYEYIKNINPDVYIQLTLKYYPIIEEIVKNSDTLGDVIIEYEKLIPKINKDLEFFTQTNIYNL